MKKRIVGIAVIFICLICFAVVIKNNQFEKFFGINISPPNNKTTEKATNEQVEEQATGNGSLTYKKVQVQVADNQIVECNQVCEAEELTKKDEKDKLQFVIGEGTISEELKPEYKVNQDIVKRFGSDTMEETGDIISDDLCYLYVPIKVTKKAAYKNQFGKLTAFMPMGMRYLILNQDSNMVTQYSMLETNAGVQFNSAPVYIRETDDKNLLTYMNTVEDFDVDMEFEFEACYVIPKEFIDSQIICLTYNFGVKLENSEQYGTQKFMKIKISGE